jgi:putative ATPase
MENGKLTLIASTTENPYFYIYNAVLSRATVFEFKPLTKEDALPAVLRAIRLAGERDGRRFSFEDGLLMEISGLSRTTVRKAVNAVELLIDAAAGADEIRLTLDDAVLVAQHSAMHYDRDGDSHYDILSAFQKSIRGSDPDAGLHYLARLLEAGDLISPCRRLLVIAAEDIGLAYPQAISIVKSCVDAANQLGLPEARIPLAEAVILLATAPKSNSAICAIDAAAEDIRAGRSGEIPATLQDAHYSGAKKLGHGKGYQYAHSFPRHYVKQQYLPDALKNTRYYRFGENKTEQLSRRYWEEIKGEPEPSER